MFLAGNSTILVLGGDNAGVAGYATSIMLFDVTDSSNLVITQQSPVPATNVGAIQPLADCGAFSAASQGSFLVTQGLRPRPALSTAYGGACQGMRYASSNHVRCCHIPRKEWDNAPCLSVKSPSYLGFVTEYTPMRDWLG